MEQIQQRQQLRRAEAAMRPPPARQQPEQQQQQQLLLLPQFVEGFGTLNDMYMLRDPFLGPGYSRAGTTFCEVFRRLFAHPRDHDAYGTTPRGECPSCGGSTTDALPALPPTYCPALVHCYFNSMFMVTGARLMQRPRAFYERLLALVDGTREPLLDNTGKVLPAPKQQPFKLESSILEVLWHMIFGTPHRRIAGCPPAPFASCMYDIHVLYV